MKDYIVKIKFMDEELKYQVRAYNLVAALKEVLLQFDRKAEIEVTSIFSL
jgi:hypothetical protein